MGDDSTMMLVFDSPDGLTRLLEPSAQQVADILLHSPYSYWEKGGDGQALISIGSRPALAITSPVPGYFFLELWCEDRLVPCDSIPCAEFVVTEMGGDLFRIPKACLVTTEIAAAAAGEFIQTRQKPTCISWLAMGAVPFEAGWYDE